MIQERKENLDDDESIIVIFLDLKRAFETVDGSKMLEKLNNFGIKYNKLKWFESFMKNRKQCTKFKHEISNEINVPIGLPQGTQLSVFLFLLYINDITQYTIC